MEVATIVTTVFYAYLLFVIIFLLLDNRDSASMFSWLLVFFFLPFVGLFMYLFFGRNWRIKKLTNQQFDKYSSVLLGSVLSCEHDRIVRLAKKTPGAKKVLELLRNNSNSVLTTDNDVRLLLSGKQKFASLKKDLLLAKNFIHLEYFIWRDDSLTNELKDILVLKAREGVEVRCLYDAFGGFFLSRKYKQELRAAGVQMYSSFKFLTPFRFHLANYRNHRKIVVIDGRVGYVGGMNLGEEHISGGKRFSSWRDLHARISGEAVLTLQGVFVTTWFDSVKEDLFSKKYFPDTKPTKKSYCPVQVTTSGPDSTWDSIKQLYFSCVTNATKNVFIYTPYFIPDQSMFLALKTAALSGVDVRVMMTGCPDKNLPFWAANTYFPELIQAGVKVYQYQKGFMHAKAVIVDSTFCSLGTANLDTRSFYLNYELNVMLYDKKLARKLEDEFLLDINYSRQITASLLEQRNLFVRLRDSIARLFAPLL